MRPAKEELQAKLLDVPPQHAFWVNNGPLLRNVYELREELKSIRDETYAYHANSGKNDFANWARDIIGDEKLAGSLKKAKNRKDAAKRVESWIEKAERAAAKYSN